MLAWLIGPEPRASLVCIAQHMIYYGWEVEYMIGRVGVYGSHSPTMIIVMTLDMMSTILHRFIITRVKCGRNSRSIK
jgi:hypothetical protein